MAPTGSHKLNLALVIPATNGTAHSISMVLGVDQLAQSVMEPLTDV